MIGLILSFFLGREFYRLAHTFRKNEWGYAILGVIIFYAGYFFTAFLIGFIGVIINPNFIIDKSTEIVLSFVCLPFGLLACWLLYRYLKKKWGAFVNDDPEILDTEYLLNDD